MDAASSDRGSDLGRLRDRLQNDWGLQRGVLCEFDMARAKSALGGRIVPDGPVAIERRSMETMRCGQDTRGTSMGVGRARLEATSIRDL